jgi:hypothetical protein
LKKHTKTLGNPGRILPNRGDLGPLPAIYLIFKQMAGKPLAAINGDKWSLYSAVIPRFSGCNPGIILGN